MFVARQRRQGREEDRRAALVFFSAGGLVVGVLGLLTVAVMIPADFLQVHGLLRVLEAACVYHSLCLQPFVESLLEFLHHLRRPLPEEQIGDLHGVLASRLTGFRHELLDERSELRVRMDQSLGVGTHA